MLSTCALSSSEQRDLGNRCAYAVFETFYQTYSNQSIVNKGGDTIAPWFQSHLVMSVCEAVGFKIKFGIQVYLYNHALHGLSNKGTLYTCNIMDF